MEFKNWIILNESVQLINDYSKTHQIVNLGKIGWWTVFSAVPLGIKPPLSIMNVAEYRQSLQKGIAVEDYLVDMTQSHLAQYFNNAAYGLSKLGFPKMHTIALIVDLSNKTNNITGGGVGGEAYRQKHGITISKSHIHINTIVHEHAHMYLFNLPRPNKEFFQNYYYKNITKAKIPAEIKWKLNPLKFDTKKLDKIIENSWNSFYEDLVRLNPIARRYFDFETAKNNNDEQALIEVSVMPSRGYYCNAILKVPLEVSAYNKAPIKLNPGTIVLVENVERYIINWRNNDKDMNPATNPRYEHPNSIEYKDLFKFVEFKTDILSPDQKERYKNSQDLLKLTGTQVFAPNSKKEEINKILDDTAEDIAQYFAHKGNDRKYSSGFDKTQLFSTFRLQYSNWMATISRRFKSGKITTVDGLKQAYLDIFKNVLNKKLDKEIPKYMNDNDFPQMSNLGTPEVSSYRDYMHQQGLVADSYGAANTDELWATSVEHAAQGQAPQQLVKLIYKTINGF